MAITQGQDRIRALLCGHSLLKRLSVYARDSPGLDQNLGLVNVDVSWITEGGKTLQWVRRNIPLITESGPNVVYLQVVGNDLDSSPCPPQQLAEDIISVCDRLRDEGVQLIILSTVLPRTKPKYLSPSQFSLRRKILDEYMRYRLVKDNAQGSPADRASMSHIWYWFHQKLDPEDPTTVLEDDGVHLSNNPGQTRLYRSIKRAMIEADKWLSLSKH